MPKPKEEHVAAPLGLPMLSLQHTVISRPGAAPSSCTSWSWHNTSMLVQRSSTVPISLISPHTTGSDPPLPYVARAQTSGRLSRYCCYYSSYPFSHEYVFYWLNMSSWCKLIPPWIKVDLWVEDGGEVQQEDVDACYVSSTQHQHRLFATTILTLLSKLEILYCVEVSSMIPIRC
ncbi:hypothetical protein LZ32DRAFT_283085 [Colletotrichum eremochloae]|nr:hypothetical protein LZ32DRAFT_283085 [Colletotrichum eremochloae]